MDGCTRYDFRDDIKIPLEGANDQLRQSPETRVEYLLILFHVQSVSAVDKDL